MGLLSQFLLRFLQVLSRAYFLIFHRVSQRVFRASFLFQKKVYQECFSWFFKRISWVFHFHNLPSFLTQAWAFHCYIYPLGSLLWECLLVIKRRDHQVFQFVIWGVGGCRLGELAGPCCVLFLRKQVRDLRVQEFLKELVVRVAAPSDVARSILVEILHCGEGGDAEQVIWTLK